MVEIPAEQLWVAKKMVVLDCPTWLVQRCKMTVSHPAGHWVGPSTGFTLFQAYLDLPVYTSGGTDPGHLLR